MISRVSNFSGAISIYPRRRGLKGSIDNPGFSAIDIYNSGQTTNGWYYIKTSGMTQSRLIYCNMTDEGGGWMMISYTPDFASATAAGLRYPNVWQNGQGNLNRMATNTMDLWYHNGSAQCTQVLKMATTTASLAPILNNMQISNKVIYVNPQNLTLATYSTDTYNFFTTQALTGSWYPVKGHTIMTTPLTVNAPRDWIYANSSWWTVCGPATQLLTDGRSGNAQGSGSWTNPSGNPLYGMANVGSASNSLRSDLRTYAVFIK